jgi:hypothetical protein
MIRLQKALSLTSPLYQTTFFSYRTPLKVASFKERIRLNNRRLDRYDRIFVMRPPNLESKNKLTFPLTIPLRVRHLYKPKKN